MSQQSDSERLCTIILQGGATSANSKTIGSTVSARPQAVQGTVWTPNIVNKHNSRHSDACNKEPCSFCCMP